MQITKEGIFAAILTEIFYRFGSFFEIKKTSLPWNPDATLRDFYCFTFECLEGILTINNIIQHAIILPYHMIPCYHY